MSKDDINTHIAKGFEDINRSLLRLNDHVARLQEKVRILEGKLAAKPKADALVTALDEKLARFERIAATFSKAADAFTSKFEGGDLDLPTQRN